MIELGLLIGPHKSGSSCQICVGQSGGIVHSNVPPEILLDISLCNDGSLHYGCQSFQMKIYHLSKSNFSSFNYEFLFRRIYQFPRRSLFIHIKYSFQIMGKDFVDFPNGSPKVTKIFTLSTLYLANFSK